MTKRVFAVATAVALVFGAGCKPRAKEITSSQRAEAAGLVSEAQFALSVRDVTRAEATLTKAVALCPDIGDYWLELGRCRMRLGQRGTAKDAYKSAVAAYVADAKREPAERVPAVLRQIYVLALLGQPDDARALLAKTQKELPDDREVRAFAEAKQLEQWLASAAFKEVAL